LQLKKKVSFNLIEGPPQFVQPQRFISLDHKNLYKNKSNMSRILVQKHMRERTVASVHASN
jgi:hypothetical protein